VPAAAVVAAAAAAAVVPTPPTYHLYSSSVGVGAGARWGIGLGYSVFGRWGKGRWWSGGEVGEVVAVAVVGE
jgi:hypothetical protein